MKAQALALAGAMIPMLVYANMADGIEEPTKHHEQHTGTHEAFYIVDQVENELYVLKPVEGEHEPIVLMDDKVPLGTAEGHTLSIKMNEQQEIEQIMNHGKAH